MLLRRTRSGRLYKKLAGGADSEFAEPKVVTEAAWIIGRVEAGIVKGQRSEIACDIVCRRV